MDYSNFIRFSDWPAVYRLDENDEEQIKADCESLDNYILYLQTKIKEANSGTNKNPSQNKV